MALQEDNLEDHDWKSASRWRGPELKLLNVVVVQRSSSSFIRDLSAGSSTCAHDETMLQQLLKQYDFSPAGVRRRYGPFNHANYQRFLSLGHTAYAWDFFQDLPSVLQTDETSAIVSDQAAKRDFDARAVNRDIREATLGDIELQSSSPASRVSSIASSVDLLSCAASRATVATTPGLPSSQQSAQLTANKDASEASFIALLKTLIKDVISHADAIEVFKIDDTDISIPVTISSRSDQQVGTENDGAIVLRGQTNPVPIIGLEAKKRRTGTTKSSTAILAQVMAQSIGTMQMRLVEIERQVSTKPHKSSWSVYTIVIHGRRVFLTRVKFTGSYLRRLELGRMTESIKVERTRDYYVNEAADLAVFVKLLYHLIQQIKHEVIQEGRLYCQIRARALIVSHVDIFGI